MDRWVSNESCVEKERVVASFWVKKHRQRTMRIDVLGYRRLLTGNSNTNIPRRAEHTPR